MVDWQSPETLAANAASFDKFLHAILGIYIWEWVTTFDFDWVFITGRKNFRWPLIFYFYGRYAMLIGLIGFVLALDVRDPIDCQALYQVLQVLGNSALGVATINLAIRTMAIWGQDRYIVIGLSLLIGGQFGVIIRSMFNVKAIFVPGSGCATASIESTIFAAMYIYTMGVDFVVLVLTAYKLVFSRTRSQSGLVKLLFKDGLLYFVVAFIGNLVAVIFSLLQLNPVMSLIADIPATTFATIAAGRVVRRLHNYISGAPEIYPSSKKETSGPGVSAAIPVFAHTGNSGGVRVEMTTFSHADGEDQQTSTNDLEAQKRYF